MGDTVYDYELANASQANNIWIGKDNGTDAKLKFRYRDDNGSYTSCLTLGSSRFEQTNSNGQNLHTLDLKVLDECDESGALSNVLLRGIAEPQSLYDATNKEYVDSLAQGLHFTKAVDFATQPNDYDGENVNSFFDKGTDANIHWEEYSGSYQVNASGNVVKDLQGYMIAYVKTDDTAQGEIPLKLDGTKYVFGQRVEHLTNNKNDLSLKSTDAAICECTVKVGERILVKDEVNASQNGIWFLGKVAGVDRANPSNELTVESFNSDTGYYEAGRGVNGEEWYDLGGFNPNNDQATIDLEADGISNDKGAELRTFHGSDSNFRVWKFYFYRDPDADELHEVRRGSYTYVHSSRLYNSMLPDVSSYASRGNEGSSWVQSNTIDFEGDCLFPTKIANRSYAALNYNSFSTSANQLYAIGSGGVVVNGIDKGLGLELAPENTQITSLNAPQGGELSIKGDGKLHVQSGDGLKVHKVTVLESTLGVSGATTLDATLDVAGATTLEASLGVSGATTLKGTLHVTGDATFENNVQAQQFTTSSDRNLKKDIQYIEDIDWDAFMALKPCTYLFNSQSDNGKKNMGFIAQDLREQYPLLVVGSEPNLSVKYAETVTILTKAIQDLKNDVEELKNRLN